MLNYYQSENEVKTKFKMFNQFLLAQGISGGELVLQQGQKILNRLKVRTGFFP